MNAIEDEAQTLDAGWGDSEAPEGAVSGVAVSGVAVSGVAVSGVAVSGVAVGEAWDSVPPPVSAAPPSLAPATEEVDGGWDDMPALAPPAANGKRRPHRQRRLKSNAVLAPANPVLLPRPAAPVKKHQRDQARQARLHEAQLQKQHKSERKAQRAAEAREETAARLRQAEAEERARQMRREARDRAGSDRPAAKAASPAKSNQKSARKAPARVVHARREEAPSLPRKRGIRSGVLVAVALLVLAAVVAVLVLRK